MQQADQPAGLWMSVSDLAAAKGLRKSSISERIARFERDGLLTTRPGPKRQKLVNLAEFDRVAGETTDLVRQTNATRAPPPPASEPGDPVLAREQARKTAYQAESARLDLEERQGKLLRVDDVAEAMARCAEAMVRAIDQLPSRADDVASAVGKDGATGARAMLKVMSRELRATLERELRLLETQGRQSETESDTPRPAEEEGA